MAAPGNDGSGGGKQVSRQDVPKMFDRIAHRYDLLNRMLSMGQDLVWRKRVARHLPQRKNLRVLDLATGTGDLLIQMSRKSANISGGIGIDLAEKMLEIGRDKLKSRQLDKKLSLQTGDAMAIPFTNSQFDVVSIAFGIRNVLDVPTSLAEMYRVLNDGGRVLVLEFSLPGNWLLRKLYLFYFRYILPLVGSVISGDSYAYRYLNKTVETFPYGVEFCKLLSEAGFQNVTFTPLTFGIASIYQGDKPPADK